MSVYEIKIRFQNHRIGDFQVHAVIMKEQFADHRCKNYEKDSTASCGVKGDLFWDYTLVTNTEQTYISPMGKWQVGFLAEKLS